MTEKTELSSEITVAFQKRIAECFSYDPENGEVCWKERPLSHFKREWEWNRHNRNSAGKVAGTITHRADGSPSYKVVSLRIGGVKRRFYLHLVIFALMGVEIPSGMKVDHRDGDIFNNKWNNLRLATDQQSSLNRGNHRGKKLPKWVSKHNAGKFYGRLTFKGKAIRLGVFNTPEEAHLACLARAERLHGEFLRAS